MRESLMSYDGAAASETLTARGSSQSVQPLQSSAECRYAASWVGLFEVGRQVEVEIGCGKGRLLVAEAEERPQVNFLGLDRAGRWMKVGIRRSEKRNLANLIFVKTEARFFLALCIPFSSVSVFHLYFPDPWPKRRHNKRRLVTAELLELMYARLIPGGLIEIATDDVDYFAHMKQIAAKSPIQWQRIREGLNQRLLAAAKTNYERKYEAQGRHLYYLELQKQGTAHAR